ncbi:MAG: glycosyltransferase [Planctomycetota bacterium]
MTVITPKPDASQGGKTGQARTLLYSILRDRPPVSNAWIAEFERVVRAIEPCDVLRPGRDTLTPGKTAAMLAKRLTGFDLGDRSKPRPAKVDRDYELMFVACQSPADLWTLRSVEGWRERCRTKVCYISDFWIKALHYVDWVPELNDFDIVATPCHESIPPLSEKLTTRAEHVRLGVDAAMFAPLPGAPRPLDVYYMGRRSEVTHAALYERSADKRFLYHFDSVGIKDVIDALQHRRLLAQTIQRSKFFIANRGFVNDLGASQQEIGARFFEGAAGGAVLIGDVPKTAVFRETFDWADAAIATPFDDPEMPERLVALLAEPERMEAMSRRNVAESLRRFDWSHRWLELLALAGIETNPTAEERVAHLATLAEPWTDTKHASQAAATTRDAAVGV